MDEMSYEEFKESHPELSGESEQTIKAAYELYLESFQDIESE